MQVIVSVMTLKLAAVFFFFFHSVINFLERVF